MADTQSTQFTNDQELIKFSLATLQKCADPDELICSDSKTLNRSALKHESGNCFLVNPSGATFVGLIEDAHSFCCSFYEERQEEAEPKDADGDSQMQEVSAFDEEGQMEMIETQQKQQKALEEMPLIVRQMRHLQIDFKAVRLYFKLLQGALKNDSAQFRAKVQEMLELILFEWQQVKENKDAPEMRIMCARGILMLLHLEQIGDFDWFDVSYEIMSAVQTVYAEAEHRRSELVLAKQDLLVQYLSSLDVASLHEFVMQLQSLITINIVTGVANMDLLKAAVRVLDLLWWVNRNFKQKGEQIEVKEFHNDAVNNNLELKPSMTEWAKQTKIQVRNCQPITAGNLFNLCSYHWILNPHNKAVLLQKYNKLEWQQTTDAFLLRAFWDPQMRRDRKSATNYCLEVSR